MTTTGLSVISSNTPNITTKSKSGTQRIGSDGGRFPLLSGAFVSHVPSVSSSGSIYAAGSFLCTRLPPALPDAQIRPDKWTLAEKDGGPRGTRSVIGSAEPLT
jgi:hypothetical protein